jgi:hypothetical protein
MPVSRNEHRNPCKSAVFHGDPTLPAPSQYRQPSIHARVSGINSFIGIRLRTAAAILTTSCHRTPGIARNDKVSPAIAHADGMLCGNHTSDTAVPAVAHESGND